MRIDRRHGPLAATLALLCVHGTAVGGGSGSLDRPADAARITALVRALAGEVDAARARRSYMPDAVVVTLRTPDWHEGAAAIGEALAARLAGVRTISARLDEINVASDGQYACAASVIDEDALMRDGSHRHTVVRELDGLRKTARGWRIVQQQRSVPTDMASGSPILDGPLATRGALVWHAAAPATPQTPAEARNAIRDWLKVNAVTPTIAEAMATYGPSDDVILFDVASPAEHRGRSELHDYFAAAMNGVDSIGYRLPSLSIATDGWLGMQISRLDLRIVRQSGDVQYMSFRQSDCLRRIGNAWYPFFEMGSFPVDRVTGKAIMAHPESFGTEHRGP